MNLSSVEFVDAEQRVLSPTYKFLILSAVFFFSLNSRYCRKMCCFLYAWVLVTACIEFSCEC
jgi:hypothetical protein